MATMIMNDELRTMEATKSYYVVHPLDDEPEEKLNPDTIGPMKMTRSVRLSLTILRFYLIFMVLLAGYRFFTLAVGIGS